MRKAGFLLLLATAALTLLPSSAVAQDENTLSAVYYLTPKPGMATKFEEGVKNHISKFHAKGDQPYIVTVVEMGAGMGEYHLIRGNRTMADFDGDGNADDAADWEANVMPYVVDGGTSRLSTSRENLSYSPEGAQPAVVSWVTYTTIKPGGFGGYFEYLEKLKEASEKGKSDRGYRLLQVINGAEAPAFVEVRGAPNWAGFSPLRARRQLIDAFGEPEAQRILDGRNAAIDNSWSFVARGRPDLGYTPE